MLVLGLAACGSPPPPPPPPTVVHLMLKTAPDVNPTETGAGAPVLVRIYQLKSPAGFEKAEFFRLFNADTATLGQDLVKKDEYLLAPDSTKTVDIMPDPGVTALGVFGAYRSFQSVTWRGTAAIPPNKSTDVAVTADGKGIVVKATPTPPKPAS